MVSHVQFPSDDELISFATQSMKRIAGLYGEEGEIGGYLTIRSASDGRIILVRQIGDCPSESFASRSRNSMEKGERLMENPEHVSSYPSRDIDNSKYGGAIRTQKYLISFSGLPEKADEALCVGIALKFGWIEKSETESSEVDAIFGASDNTLGKEALALMLN